MTQIKFTLLTVAVFPLAYFAIEGRIVDIAVFGTRLSEIISFCALIGTMICLLFVVSLIVEIMIDDLRKPPGRR